jgi:cytochrome c oxidase assembly protein subunit 11
MFYRIKNKTDKPLLGFATYTIYPEEASTYFTKIQCFCFNNQLLTARE